MQLLVRKLDPNAKLPTRAHDSDAGFDLYSPITVTIGVGATVNIPTGLAIALPEQTVGLIYPRSSLGTRHGIVLSNTVGVIDSGYRGQVMLVLTNNGDKPYTINARDRVAQMIVTPYLAPDVVEVDALPDSDRGTGGFGSTGQ